MCTGRIAVYASLTYRYRPMLWCNRHNPIPDIVARFAVNYWVDPSQASAETRCFADSVNPLRRSVASSIYLVAEDCRNLCISLIASKLLF
jgi:hypothetical protein